MGTCARLLIARRCAALSSKRSNGTLQAVQIGLRWTQTREASSQASWVSAAGSAGGVGAELMHANALGDPARRTDQDAAL